MKIQKSSKFPKKFEHKHANEKNFLNFKTIVTVLVNTEVLHIAYVI